MEGGVSLTSDTCHVCHRGRCPIVAYMPLATSPLRLLLCCLPVIAVAADRIAIAVPPIEEAGAAWTGKMDAITVSVVSDALAVGFSHRIVSGLRRDGTTWSAKIPDGYDPARILVPWQGGVALPIRRMAQKAEGNTIALLIAADGSVKPVDGGPVDINDQCLARTAWVEADGADQRLVLGAMVRRKSATGTTALVQTLTISADGANGAVQEGPLSSIDQTRWTDPDTPRRLRQADHAVLFAPPLAGLPAILCATPAGEAGAPPTYPRLVLTAVSTDTPLPAISKTSGEILVGWSDAERPGLRQVSLLRDAIQRVPIPIPGMVIQDEDVGRGCTSWWSPTLGAMVVLWTAKSRVAACLSVVDVVAEVPSMRTVALSGKLRGQAVALSKDKDGTVSLTVVVGKTVRRIQVP